MAGDTQSEQTFQTHELKQLLVLVRYKPAGAMGADAVLGGAADAVQGVVDTVENTANSIPGLNLFFKEEKEPEKKTDKEYNYFKDYKEWDSYMKKMENELPEKLKEDDNQAFVFEFDATDAQGREQEGKKLYNQVKSKVAGWKDYEAAFHFVGIGQGGNVANECIKELSKEAGFKDLWYVKSLIYIGTPVYKNLHQFDEDKAFNRKGKKYEFGNNFDLTHQVIAYFEPYDDLLKMIAESNSNTLSIFTGKIKAQFIATLGRLLSIESFGTGSDNEGNINKITQCKDDISNLVTDCKDACLAVFNAVPGLVDPGKLPEFKKLSDGFGQVPDLCVNRLKVFADEFQKAKEGTSLDTNRIGLNKIFNVFCPLVDQLTKMLQVFTYDEATQEQAMDKILDKSGVKKILAPGKSAATNIPADPYIEKVIAMALEAEQKAKEQKETSADDEKQSDDTADTSAKPEEQVLYDQSIQMINTAKNNLIAVTEKGDLDISKASAEEKKKVCEAIVAMLLPMMPSKKKFYGKLLEYLPLGGFNSFVSGLTADAAAAPLRNLVSRFVGDFDEGTPENPGLKTSIKNLDTELKRIKGFFNKNNYPVHKDANSLYFIYNSHNLILKKPYGQILNTIDRETGYLDTMGSMGFSNTYDVQENRYSGKGEQKGNEQPVIMMPREEKK